MTEYTPEQQAIRLFLSKPAPYNSACGCMGQQKMPSNQLNSFSFNQYEVTLDKNFIDRGFVILLLRNFYNTTLFEAKKRLDADVPFGFNEFYELVKFTMRLKNSDIPFSITENPSGLYPVCPCAMQYVMEVDRVFYQIKEHRSPDGITHTAVELGPVGGPYKIKGF